MCEPFIEDILIDNVLSILKRVRHVIIVDNNERVRDLMQRMLNDKGITSTLAVDGMDVFNELEGMENNLPDMIVRDLMMPCMNGFEVLDQLECHHKWANIHVVVSTAKTLSNAGKLFLASKGSNPVPKESQP